MNPSSPPVSHFSIGPSTTTADRQFVRITDELYLDPDGVLAVEATCGGTVVTTTDGSEFAVDLPAGDVTDRLNRVPR